LLGLDPSGGLPIQNLNTGSQALLFIDEGSGSPIGVGGVGHHRIRRMLILGLGPSGLLFIQYLRNEIRFDGELFAADLQETKLELAAQFGASSVNVRNQDLVSEIQTRTGGKKLGVTAAGSRKYDKGVSQC
jgi:threonine dehydrogenase-like Zn-dependent dehydrogenase